MWVMIIGVFRKLVIEESREANLKIRAPAKKSSFSRCHWLFFHRFKQSCFCHGQRSEKRTYAHARVSTSALCWKSELLEIKNP